MVKEKNIVRVEIYLTGVPANAHTVFSVFKTNWNVLALFGATHHIHFCTVAPTFFFFFFFPPLSLGLSSNIDFATGGLD